MHIIYEYTLQVILFGRLCVPACKLYMCAWTIHCIWLLSHNILLAHLRGTGGELLTVHAETIFMGRADEWANYVCL